MEKHKIQDYIGDGVYVEFDGFGVWAKANHHEHPTDQVYFEPMVLKGFIRFLRRAGFNIEELCKE